MPHQRNFIWSILYTLLRIAPTLTAFAIIDLSGLSVDEYVYRTKWVLSLLAVLALWGMTEGLCMVWVRKKNANTPDARGYGAVAIIAAIIVLTFLQVFRNQASQTQFLILLGALACRGMARGGWEQGRPQVALLASIGGHTLIALTSFLSLLGTLPWPTFVVSSGVGALAGALEASWHSAAFGTIRERWVLPVHRMSIVYPPLALGTLAFFRILPPPYVGLLLLTIPATRIARSARGEDRIPDRRYRAITGMYLVFVAIMLTCLVVTGGTKQH
jgi:hypothetical protein